jgi:1,2-diacylglycerol 3-alpha-glucosyltransferase
VNGKWEIPEVKNLRVAVLFHRIGPYHFSRLRAAGRVMSIVAIESSGADETYAWDVVAGADHFMRMILFECVDAENQPVAEVATRVDSALNKVRPAVVVVPGWADSAARSALHWCVQNHVPAIVMSESTVWDETRVTWKEWVKRRIVGLSSAALVGGTPHKDYMVRLGMPVERIFLGYDAVDNDYFAAKTAELRTPNSELRTRLGLPENYFLASARFVKKKNLPRLLQAYARYRAFARRSESGHEEAGTSNIQRMKGSSLQGGEGEPPWDLVLLGDGPLRSSILDLRSSLGLDACVHLPGFKQYGELPAYYALAKAFIHASTTEQWGLVVNEAMASGLPVLVSNRCGCAQDLVREGVNGFTFDPCNVEELAQLMLKLSTLNAQRSTLGAASREIISHWGLERFAEGLCRATEMAVREPAPRANLLDRALLGLLLRRQATGE